MARWMIVDGSNWFYIDFKGAGFKAPGTLMRRVHDVKHRFKFDRVVVCFDSPPSWRYDHFENYKPNREEKPPHFFTLLEQTLSDLRASPYELFMRDRMEADDLIGELCADAIAEGSQAVIFSADADYHQLLSPGWITQCVKVDRQWGGHLEFKFVTADDVFKLYGVHSHQWVDYRSLVGDKSDGLGGCRGVGPPVASEILQKCGSLEKFAQSPFSVHLGEKTRNKVLRFIREDLELYRKLITLDPNSHAGVQV